IVLVSFFPLYLELLQKQLAEFKACFRQRGVKRGEFLIKYRLPPGKYRIERDILRDALERNVRNTLINQPACHTRFFSPHTVVFVLGRKQPLPRDRHRNAARVDCNPTPAPLLRDKGRCTRTAGWV